MRLRPLVILLLCLYAATSSAADNKAAAREAYRNGTRMYDLGRYREALAEFEKAYVNY